MIFEPVYTNPPCPDCGFLKLTVEYPGWRCGNCAGFHPEVASAVVYREAVSWQPEPPW